MSPKVGLHRIEDISGIRNLSGLSQKHPNTGGNTMKTSHDKPHWLRSMKELAERLPAGTVIRYMALAERPKKNWDDERARIGRIAMRDHLRRKG